MLTSVQYGILIFMFILFIMLIVWWSCWPSSSSTSSDEEVKKDCDKDKSPSDRKCRKDVCKDLDECSPNTDDVTWETWKGVRKNCKNLD